MSSGGGGLQERPSPAPASATVRVTRSARAPSVAAPDQGGGSAGGFAGDQSSSSVHGAQPSTTRPVASRFQPTVWAPRLLLSLGDLEHEQLRPAVAVEVADVRADAAVLVRAPVRDRRPVAPSAADRAVGVEPAPDAVMAAVALRRALDGDEDQRVPVEVGDGEVGAAGAGRDQSGIACHGDQPPVTAPSSSSVRPTR